MTDYRTYTGETVDRELLLDIHDECYTAAEGDPDGFNSRETFAGFVDGWSRNTDFACVIGWDGQDPVGFAYGAPLQPGAPWWNCATDFLSPEFIHETGKRTFAVSEIMVRPHWRGTGEAESLHNQLLQGRTEERATLLVEVAKVRALYERWGYAYLGTVQPVPDAPNMDLMIKPL